MIIGLPEDSSFAASRALRSVRQLSLLKRTTAYKASRVGTLAPTAKVLFDFDAENIGELSLCVGQTVLLLDNHSDAWYKGAIGTVTGIFPKNFV